MARYEDYQYGTSPRKLEPEYERPVKKKTKRPVQKKKQVNKKNANSKAKKKQRLVFEIKFFVNSMIVFAMVFAIIACQALVDQRYKEKEELKREYDELLASSMASSDNSEDIRKVANDYGMQTKSATLIDLGTTDYIESSVETIEVEKSLWDKIAEFWQGLF